MSFLVPFRSDLSASRLASGLLGEKLPSWSEGVGGQLGWPISNAGREEGGGDSSGRDPIGEGGVPSGPGLQPQSALPAGESKTSPYVFQDLKNKIY